MVKLQLWEEWAWSKDLWGKTEILKDFVDRIEFKKRRVNENLQKKYKNKNKHISPAMMPKLDTAKKYLIYSQV